MPARNDASNQCYSGGFKPLLYTVCCANVRATATCWFHIELHGIMEITTDKFSIPVSQHSTQIHIPFDQLFTLLRIAPTFPSLPHTHSEKTSAFSSSSPFFCSLSFYYKFRWSRIKEFSFFSIRRMNKSDYIRMKALSPSLINLFAKCLCVYGSANFESAKFQPTLKWIIKNEMPFFTFLILISQPS